MNQTKEQKIPPNVLFFITLVGLIILGLLLTIQIDIQDTQKEILGLQNEIKISLAMIEADQAAFVKQAKLKIEYDKLIKDKQEEIAIFKQLGTTQADFEHQIKEGILPEFDPLFKIHVFDYDYAKYMYSIKDEGNQGFKESGTTFTSVVNQYTPTKIGRDYSLNIGIGLLPKQNLPTGLAYVVVLLKESNESVAIVKGDYLIEGGRQTLSSTQIEDKVIFTGIVQLEKMTYMDSFIGLDACLVTMEGEDPEEDLHFDIIILTEEIQSRQNFTILVD